MTEIILLLTKLMLELKMVLRNKLFHLRLTTLNLLIEEEGAEQDLMIFILQTIRMPITVW